MTDYDVIVVGAGPGGSVAAKTCAENGLDVLLIEKRQEIGVPVRCAEGVGREEFEEFVNPDEKWIASEIENAELYSPSGYRVKLSAEQAGNEVGYVLERKIFDRYLAKLASRAGADVLTKTSAVSMKRENGTVKLGIRSMGEFQEMTAKIIVGADGVESRVAKWAGIDTTLRLNEIESCIQYLITNIDFEPETTYFWVGRKYAPGGYIWLFPKGEDAANVGIGVMPSMAEKPAKYYLDRFVKENFPKGEIVEVVVGGVPVKGAIDTAVADNVMLVGDAARHTDPITGGGIINAMKAGYHAGMTAFQAVESNDFSEKFLRKYDERWMDDFGKTLIRNKKLQEMMVKLEDSTFDKLFRGMGDMPIEDMGVKRLALELLKREPKLLWSLKEFLV